MRFIQIFVFIFLLLIVSVAGYLNSPKFGAIVFGEQFKNIYPINLYGAKQGKLLKKPSNFLKLFKALNSVLKNQKSQIQIPSQKTDLKTLDPNEDVLIWFGHSSYFIQIEGKKFLVDPIFSKSLFFFGPRAFPGSDIYEASDIPEVDFLIITHDHFDHLDFETVRKLKFKKAICPLKVGKHLKRWNVQDITEMNWFESIPLSSNFKLFCLPAQHFSRRGFLKNRTLWASFLIETPKGFKIFLGGDGGYSPHFSDIQKKFQTIDLAILENGQYSPNWPKIHMAPNETIEAAKNLNAKALLPVHNSKFSLAPHKWNEPLIKLSELALNQDFKLKTPMIGEKVDLKNPNQKFKKWWEN